MWTVIHFLQRFTADLYHAILFSAQEFDDDLQMTKTPKQRLIIWSVIAIGVCVICYALLHGVWYFLDTLDTSNVRIE